DKALTEALAISQESGAAETLMGAQLLANVGQLELSRGNLEQANKFLGRSLELTRELAGPRHPAVATVLLDISNVRTWMDDVQGAERAAREAVNIYRQTVHERHPHRVMADYHLARVLNLQGRTKEAAELYESTLA